MYELGRDTERALNGYINYIWSLRTGRETFGDRYVAEEPLALPEE